MKTRILLLFFLCQKVAFSQGIKEVKTWGGASSEFINCVEVDGFGNIYVAGNFDGEFELGSSKITSKDGADGFIARLNSDFSVMWKVHLSNADTVLVNALDFDKSGNIYVGGVYQSAFDVNHTNGKSTLKNTNNNSVFDGFALKLDSLGRLQGSYIVDESTGNELHDIVVTQNDYVIVAGQIAGNKSKPDGLLVGTSLNGKTTWKQEMVGAGEDVYTSLDEDQSGNILVSGYFTSSAKFDGGNASKSAKGTAAVLGVYSQKGDFKNAVVLHDGNVRPKQILTYDDDIVIVSGLYTGVLAGVSSYNFEDGFISLMYYNDSTNDFTTRWTSHINNYGALDVNGISLSNDEKEVALTGYYYGDLYSGQDTLLDPKLPNAFCAFFETNRGETNDLMSMGTEDGTSIGLGISTYRDGYLLSGAFDDDATFGDTTVSAEGNVDAFLAHLDELEVWLRADKHYKCRDINDTIDVIISISVKGDFYKGNEVFFEISKDVDFKNYFTQKVQEPTFNVATVHMVDTLSAGQYYVRLASTNPRVVSDGIREIFLAPNFTNLPTIIGPDTVTMRQEYTYTSLNNNENTITNSWWVSPVNYVQNKQDTSTDITFSSEGVYVVRTRNTSEFGCESKTAEKTVVVAPENYMGISYSKSFYSCSHDTFGFRLYTQGHFGKPYGFVVLMDSNKVFSNPQLIDTINIYPDIIRDEEYIILDISGLDRTNYYLKVKSLQPQIEVLSYERVILGAIPATPEISGSKTVKINQTYTYTTNGSSNENFVWFVDSGEVVNGQGTNTIDVKWTHEGSGRLICYRAKGCYSIPDTFYADITSSIGGIKHVKSIYPNPAKNALFLNMKSNATFSLASIDGKKVMEEVGLTKGENTIDLSGLKPGMYIVQLVSENETSNLVWKIE